VRGVLKPDSGTALIASDAPLPIGYMGQNPYLFNRSLRDNLTLGILEATDEELRGILHSVGLASKLDSLKEGLDTIVGETGTGFSGGEAHRIALARVLVADAPIIIVDEPFSALDPVTEASLLETLFEVGSRRTLVVITHHLAEIHRFDRVVFIEDGTVALDGAPDELVEQSAFYRMLLEFDRGM
jgi:ATP-binding cassette subfamily C protein CydC